MLRSKILSMLSVLIIAVTMLIPTGLPVLAAAPVKAAADSPTCRISLLAPWKAGNQIRARATITCSAPYANLQVRAWLEGYGLPQVVTCHNTKSCQATVSHTCKTGYWRSGNDGQVWDKVSKDHFWSPLSPYTYIKC
jgi:hypothetical protein